MQIDAEQDRMATNFLDSFVDGEKLWEVWFGRILGIFAILDQDPLFLWLISDFIWFISTF
jgi:hypothetical protein